MFSTAQPAPKETRGAAPSIISQDVVITWLLRSEGDILYETMEVEAGAFLSGHIRHSADRDLRKRKPNNQNQQKLLQRAQLSFIQFLLPRWPVAAPDDSE